MLARFKSVAGVEEIEVKFQTTSLRVAILPIRNISGSNLADSIEQCLNRHGGRALQELEMLAFAKPIDWNLKEQALHISCGQTKIPAFF